MTQNNKETYIRAYIDAMRQHFITYHNHKEQMAYVATALYLTGASAFFFQKPLDVMHLINYQCAMVIVVTVLSTIAFKFICWQLSLRSLATDIIEACDRLRLRWLQAFPPDLDMSPKKYKNYIDMPKFLHDEALQSTVSETTKISRKLTFMSIIITYIVLIIRILYYKIITPQQIF